MCESVVCGLHYGLNSIFKHTNELDYCNLLHDESIQKTNNKKYMYRCICGMICCTGCLKKMVIKLWRATGHSIFNIQK